MKKKVKRLIKTTSNPLLLDVDLGVLFGLLDGDGDLGGDVN